MLSGRAIVLGLIHRIRIQHTVLFQIVGHCVLGQKWRLQRDFGADPFALCMRDLSGVFADSAGTEPWAKGGSLNFIELAEFLPGFISHRAGDVDLQFHDGHE